MDALRALSPASRSSSLQALPRAALQKLAKEAGLRANAKSADIVSSLLGSLGAEDAAPAQLACEHQPTAAQEGETPLSEASVEPCSTADRDAAPAAQPTSGAADVCGSERCFAAVPAPGCVAGVCAEDCALDLAQGLRQDVAQPPAGTDAEIAEVGTVTGAAARASSTAAAAACVDVAEAAAAAAVAVTEESRPTNVAATAAVAFEAAAFAARTAVAETSAAAVLPPAAALLTPLAAAEAAVQATAAADTAAGTAVPENSAAAGSAPTGRPAEAAPYNASAAPKAAPVAMGVGGALKGDVNDDGSGPAAERPGGVRVGLGYPGLMAGPAGLGEDAATAASSTPPGSSPATGAPGEAAGHGVSAADQAAGPPARDTCAPAARGPGEGAGSGVGVARQAAEPAALDSPLLARAFERGRQSGIFLGSVQAHMAALEEQWDVYKVRVGAPDPQAAAATAAALAGAGFTTVSSPALRPAQRAALARRVGGSKRPRVDPTPSAGAADASDTSNPAKLARGSGGSRGAAVAGGPTASAPAALAGTDRSVGKAVQVGGQPAWAASPSRLRGCSGAGASTLSAGRTPSALPAPGKGAPTPGKPARPPLAQANTATPGRRPAGASRAEKAEAAFAARCAAAKQRAKA